MSTRFGFIVCELCFFLFLNHEKLRYNLHPKKRKCHFLLRDKGTQSVRVVAPLSIIITQLFHFFLHPFIIRESGPRVHFSCGHTHIANSRTSQVQYLGQRLTVVLPTFSVTTQETKVTFFILNVGL